jgi:hypothetical protein
MLSAGKHQLQFDAHRLASGIYVAKMSASEFSRTIKINLLK